MISLKVTLKNEKSIRRALRKYPRESVKQINRAVEKSVIRVHRDAQRKAPVNKQSGGGNLRQSIKRKTRRLEGVVYAGAKYAIFVHEGTRPHTITVKNKKVLANRKSGKFFGKRVRHPGTQPQPFLANAVKENKRKIRGYFLDSMKNILIMIK